MVQQALRLLIVDDEKVWRDQFRRYLQELKLDHLCRIEEAQNSRDAVTKCNQLRPHAVLLDLKLDPGDLLPEDGDFQDLATKLGGIKVLNHISQNLPDADVLIISVIQDEATMQACCGKAAKYVGKPINHQQLLFALKPTLDRLGIGDLLADSDQKSDVIITPGLEGIVAKVKRVAKTKSSVLLVGPSGAGKEIVARLIHKHSTERANKPFIAHNCGDSELSTSRYFGHLKGAFTGAENDHAGVFEQANGGILFLDEIGEMPLADQARLLRVLQDAKVKRLGATDEQAVQVDVQVIAATNRNLADAVRNSKFREDLLYRLKGVQIEVPPLRDRLDDLDWLVPCCLEKLRAERGVESYGYTTEAMGRLKEYRWPGNVRELENVLQEAAIEAEGEPIGARHIVLAETNDETTDSALGEGLGIYASLKDNRRKLEENQIRALRTRNMSDQQICKIMGIHRSSLYRKTQGMQPDDE